MKISNNVGDLLDGSYQSIEGVLVTSGDSTAENQAQTNKIFSDKWVKYSEEEIEAQERLFAFQREWYLALYDFADENALGDYLQQQEVILDAGCGLGYKAHWFSQLSPDSLVIGMDYSDAVFVAADRYAHIPNLKFVKGDIADTRLKKNVVSYVSCDQVIHHTEDPQKTMIELARILKPGGELAVYVYAKKALPRELLDDHFRLHTKDIPADEMWQMSEQLTELGKRLSDLNVNIDVPEIPLLGIQGGAMDIQRFIYWNFLKCFWNEDLGRETSISTNYDWYAPSNATRYSKSEFVEMIENSGLSVNSIHTEEACHSGRFKLVT